MHVAALRFDLRIRDAHSLKEKRHIIKALMAHVSRTFDVAISEVDHMDLWQRATLGVALVSASQGHLERKLRSVERAMRSRDDVEVLAVGTAYLESPQ